MTDWSNSTYLDYAGYGLTLAAPAVGSGQSATEAALGITDGMAVTDSSVKVTVALTLDRANDPTTLLSSNWATRQALLKQAEAAGGVGQVYGARQADFAALADDLTAKGIPVATSGNLSSAESRTVWVTLDAAQFQALFGTQLMVGTATIVPDNFTTVPGGTTPIPSTSVLYWNGALSPDTPVPLDGMWIENKSDDGLQVGLTPTPVVSNPAAATLPGGFQGVGNSLHKSRITLYPNRLAAHYGFPLAGTAVSTPAVGLIENGTGNSTGVGEPTIGDYVGDYLAAAGVSGTVTVSEGQVENAPHGAKSGERSLDVSVVAAAAPNSNQILYAGDGHGSFSSMQEAIWDGSNTLGTLSSSISEPQRPAPGSPFYAAYQALMQDAALRNISVFMSAGDGGSSEKIGNGVPMTDISHDSPYAVVVGGTSLSTQAQAATDPSIEGYVTAALAGDGTVLRMLVEGGMKTLPTSAGNVAPFIETTWNTYTYTPADRQTNGLTSNLAGAGGIDTAFAQPQYQTAYGIDIAKLSYSGTQAGRGIPDVSALASGNAGYKSIAENGIGEFAGAGGTSASAPLWAALTAQIQAIFADQGLPATGYFNDLLYMAAAVAPASFNDVTVGGNTSSFVYGGTTTDMTGTSAYHITPTGIGYSATAGYDLTTGLGTPNGILLARALTQIAQAETYGSSATPVSDPSGLTSAAAQALIVQSTLAAGAADVTAAGATFQADAGSGPGWSARIAQQVLQSHFDPQLVAAISGQAQAGSTQVTVANGQSLAATVGSTATNPTGQADTAAFGFVTDTDGAGNTVTYARPLAVAETYGGQDGTEAILRIRQTSAHDDSLSLYRVDDLLGDIDGIAPGQAGYAQAAAGRAYATQAGATAIATPSQDGFLQANIEGVDKGAIIGFSLKDDTAGQTHWGLAAQNTGGVNALWSYGANTWGFNDGTGDGSFADTVFQLDFTSNAGSGLLAFDATPACFVAGTLIATPLGERPVELLAIGDQVVTVDGESRPIHWIGRRSYAGQFLAAQPGLHPVRFCPGSLGDGLPRRSLMVSPEHALLIDGVLVPARCLVDGKVVMQEAGFEAVEYVHIELDTHAVILAEGAPFETFVDDNSRGIFHNASEYRVLYPDAVAKPARYCAERLREGEALAALRKRVAERRAVCPKPGSLLGWLDDVKPTRITGWACDSEHPDRKVRVRITANDVVLGIVVADRERADLRQAGHGDGRFGFELVLDAGLLPGRTHQIRAERLEDGAELSGSPLTVQHGVVPAFAAQAATLRGHVDEATRTRIRGWAWDPASPHDPVGLQIVANGSLVAAATANRFRADLLRAGIGNGWHGFEVTIPGGLSPLTRHAVEVRRDADGARLPVDPTVLETADSFGPDLESAVLQAVQAAADSPDSHRVLSFMLAQADRLRRATGVGLPAGDGVRRILVIDERLPIADRDAGSQALLSHMRTLQELGYAVYLVTGDGTGAQDPAAAALLATGITVYAPPHHSCVEDVLRREAGRFELVYLHRHGSASRYLGLVRSFQPQARVLYSVADLHHVRLARQAALFGDARLLAESRQVRASELAVAAGADVVITHSSAEAAMLRSALPRTGVHCVGWVPQRRRLATPFARRSGLAFVGSLDHAPNLDALWWLVQEVMPLVWRENPAITCTLAGSAMPRCIEKLAGPGLVVAGHVDKLHELFGRVRLTVAPLRFGAGLKGKVLDSFAAGLPCAMTPVAAEGMSLPPALRASIGRDAAEMAAVIVRLHDDLAENRRAAAAARRLVARDYSQAAITASMRGALLTGQQVSKEPQRASA